MPLLLRAAVSALLVRVVGWVLGDRASARRKQRPARQLRRLARAAGLRPGQVGSVDPLRLPFPIMRAGEWQGYDHAHHGSLGESELVVFDFWTGYEVHGHEVETAWTCAAVRLPARCPKLAVNRETPWSRAWGHLGWRGIEMESDAFNRRFSVSGDDRRFAHAFLDAGMIDWLLRTPKEFSFAVNEEWLLAYAPCLPTARWWTLLRMIRDARLRVPDAVPRLYPLDAPASAS